MAQYLMVTLFSAPLIAGALSLLVRRSRFSEYATVLAAIVDLAASILLLREALQHRLTFLHDYI